jgi:hypothetical protein
MDDTSAKGSAQGKESVADEQGASRGRKSVGRISVSIIRPRRRQRTVVENANKPATTTAPISALFICFLEPKRRANATGRGAFALNCYIALSREARPYYKEETNGYDGERS